MTAPTGLLHSEMAGWRGSKQFQGYGAIAIIAAEGNSLRIRRISSFFAIVLDVMDLVLFHPSVNLSRKVVVTKITTDPPRPATRREMISATVPAKTIYCRAPTASPRAQHRSASPAMARPQVRFPT